MITIHTLNMIINEPLSSTPGPARVEDFRVSGSPAQVTIAANSNIGYGNLKLEEN